MRKVYIQYVSNNSNGPDVDFAIILSAHEHFRCCNTMSTQNKAWNETKERNGKEKEVGERREEKEEMNNVPT